MRLCAFGHLMSEAELEGLCPQCLIALVPPQPPQLTPIGRFELLRKLGEGGFGSVYLARELAPDGKPGLQVALKVIRHGHFASEKVLAAFRSEIKIHLQVLSQLRDERIVRIHESGEHDGLPFFTMEYMTGGTLGARMAEFRASPRRAAELMIEIAEAVDFLHYDPENPARPPILHRDLKPENILFDASGRPKISDFGIAKIATEKGWPSTTLHAGCPWYVAPEQAFRKPSSRPPTPAADVYSLGAILYELFTGVVPFEGTEAEVFQKLGDELAEPRSPRDLLDGKLDRYLETVVLNALEKKPARRYQSARAFVADLRRALSENAPEELPTIPVRDRLWSSLRRYAALAATLVWTVAFAVYGAVHELRARALEHQTIAAQLRENAAIASVQAVAFQFQLREHLHRVARLAEQPEVVALLKSTVPEHPSKWLVDRSSGFDSMFVLAPDGRMRGRTTRRTEEYMTRSFAFRDYFRGARALGGSECPTGTPAITRSYARTAYLGRAHVSESEGEFEIAISAPICDERGWLGVLGATISSNKGFGAVRLQDGPAGHITALLGPRGGDRKDIGQPLPDDLTFIVHPRLAQGSRYQLKHPKPKDIRDALGIPAPSAGLRYVEPFLVSDYRDPLAEHTGLWTAAIAPVDESGFVVLVQSPRAPERSRVAFLTDQDLAIPLALFTAGLGALTWLHFRFRRRFLAGPHRNAWIERS